jgi:hypothetical protein
MERTGQVIGKNGKPSRGLFAIGPLCQGTLWEITALPEIVSQADGAAINIVELRRQTKAEFCCYNRGAQLRSWWVRFGSGADIRERIRDVRFTPQERTRFISVSMSAMCH